MSTRSRTRHLSKINKTTVPIRGDWDILPHGLGKKGDLMNEDVKDDKDLKDDKNAKEDQDAKDDKDGMDKDFQDLKTKKKHPALKKKTEAKDDRDDDFQKFKPKGKDAALKNKTRARGNKANKVNGVVADSSSTAKQGQKKAANKYGLTPGLSPFPDHAMPTPEQCEEVKRLLSELHGEVNPPETIPPPSMDVTGCGEVPDLLDAILRTLLSAATTANNSNLSLKGLKEHFGLRTSGVGKGSVNWEAVLEADDATIERAIKSGGLAAMKSKSIKNILTTVYNENCARRDALITEMETGKTANILGADHEIQKAKDMEIAKANDNMLSLDHIFEMTTEEAMEELTKLPGIGVKTASCVILFCMKRPSFAVDTHVWRHCKMLGWVPATASRDKTFSHCEVRVPDHLKYQLHQLFLKHGRTCGRCAAKGSAEEYGSTVCPIEHLVTRPERKRGVASKKRKRGEDTETEDASLEGEDED